jgi:hypothetical protein
MSTNIKKIKIIGLPPRNVSITEPSILFFPLEIIKEILERVPTKSLKSLLKTCKFFWDDRFGKFQESTLKIGYGKSKKYIVGKNTTVKKVLKKYGVAIVPGVLTSQECKNMFDGSWSYFEHISQGWNRPIARNDKSTWRGFYDLYPLHSMLVQHWQVGHPQSTWDVRQNPKVVKVFSDIWKVEPTELVSSFDGMSFNIPPEDTNKGWHRQTWYHSDQSFTRHEYECVQSWVTSLRVKKGDATLGFLEKSHKYHNDFAQEFDIQVKEDWYKLGTSDEINFYTSTKGCQERRIQCLKGDMVLWDSRTIHCGVEPLRIRNKPNFRNVIYICCLPRSLFTETELKKKRKALEELRTTTHKGKLFAKNPRTYGGTLPHFTELPNPKLTPLGKKLAGY